MPNKVEETDAAAILKMAEDPETNKAAGVGQTGNQETATNGSSDPREMIERAGSVKLSDDHNNN